MATCDLEVVNHHGARPLCRFMYTEHGFAMPTMHDGGSHVHYRQVATQLGNGLRNDTPVVQVLVRLVLFHGGPQL